MSTLDDLIRSPDTLPQHPVVQWLSDRLAASDEICVAPEFDDSSLGPSIVGLFVLRKENGQEQTPQFFAWDDDLNTAMIKLGIKARTVDEEGERFARGIRSALHKVERRYGDGYMNAVLVDFLEESNFGKSGELGAVLSVIHSNQADRNTKSYQQCRELIASEIGGRAKELRDQLKYSPDQLESVMNKALARYLDRRFSISSLRRLGWIDKNGRTTR